MIGRKRKIMGKKWGMRTDRMRCVAGSHELGIFRL
jgi:hypothetical protein